VWSYAKEFAFSFISSSKFRSAVKEIVKSCLVDTVFFVLTGEENRKGEQKIEVDL